MGSGTVGSAEGRRAWACAVAVPVGRSRSAVVDPDHASLMLHGGWFALSPLYVCDHVRGLFSCLKSCRSASEVCRVTTLHYAPARIRLTSGRIQCRARLCPARLRRAGIADAALSAASIRARHDTLISTPSAAKTQDVEHKATPCVRAAYAVLSLAHSPARPVCRGAAPRCSDASPRKRRPRVFSQAAACQSGKEFRSSWHCGRRRHVAWAAGRAAVRGGSGSRRPLRRGQAKTKRREAARRLHAWRRARRHETWLCRRAVRVLRGGVTAIARPLRADVLTPLSRASCTRGASWRRVGSCT